MNIRGEVDAFWKRIQEGFADHMFHDLVYTDTGARYTFDGKVDCMIVVEQFVIWDLQDCWGGPAKHALSNCYLSGVDMADAIIRDWDLQTQGQSL